MTAPLQTGKGGGILKGFDLTPQLILTFVLVLFRDVVLESTQDNSVGKRSIMSTASAKTRAAS